MTDTPQPAVGDEELRQNIKFEVLVPLVSDIVIKRQEEQGSLRKEDESPRYNAAVDQIMALLTQATKRAELEGRIKQHQSWSIVYGIGYDPDNHHLPRNINALRAKWSKDELDINAQLRALATTEPAEAKEKGGGDVLES